MNYAIVMPKLAEINEQGYQFPLGMAYIKMHGKMIKAHIHKSY